MNAQPIVGNIWENLFNPGAGIFGWLFGSPVAITASTPATAQEIMRISNFSVPATSNPTRALIYQFFIPAITTTVTGKELRFILVNNNTSTIVGITGYSLLSNTGFNLNSVYMQGFFTDLPSPANNPQDYSLKGYLSTASGTATCIGGPGDGTAGAVMPMAAWVFFSSPVNI